MRSNKILTALALFTLVTTSNTALADTVVRTGDTVSVAEDKGIVADFYTAGSIVNISGTIEGDMISAAGRATLNGSVSGDVLIIGGSVDIHGPVGDDVRIIGGEVVIAESVAGDLFVMGGTVSILSTATIGGDVLIYGGQVEIAGPVGGNVLGTYGTLRIDAPVGKDVQVTTKELVLGDNAVITGSVVYESDNIVQRSPNAVVEEEIVRNDRVTGEAGNSDLKQYLIAALMVAFAALLWFLVSRRTLETITKKATEHSVRPASVGFAFTLLVPVVAAILFTSMLGILVAIVITILYLLVLTLAAVASPVVVGNLILKTLNQPTKKLSLTQIGLGVAATTLILLIPILGLLLGLVVYVVTIGAMIDLLMKLHTT